MQVNIKMAIINHGKLKSMTNLKENIPCLSIRQPWAWLIAQGYKDVENRTWRTKHRGTIYIHASQTIDTLAVSVFKEELPDITFPKRFDTGGIIGRAELIDCVTEHGSEWFEGPYGFVMANPELVDYYPLKGKLRLFHATFP